MDILRKELDEIYSRQKLCDELLPADDIVRCRNKINALAEVCGEIDVITDVAADRCYIYSGSLSRLLGLTEGSLEQSEYGSSDEDEIYGRMHPEDLAEKRMLEYEFFKHVDNEDSQLKRDYKAVCRIRMRNNHGAYVYVDNSTQVLYQSPNGKMWLILCRYSLSSSQNPGEGGFSAAIVDTASGDIRPISFAESKKHILTQREKEILLLIREGKPSKQIADILGISINTVNRHRQNIIAKLNVGNSVEAISAAMAMKLL